MNKIYALRNDGYKYQELRLYIDDIISARPFELLEREVLEFSLENLAMAEWWPRPDPVFVAIDDDPQATIPDISEWIDGTLVLSPKAYRVLCETLADWGEFLPIGIKRETFYIFNCLRFGEADEALSEKEFYEGEELGLKSIFFKPDDIAEKLIFKSKINACGGLFCHSRFKDLVIDFEMTGVIFDENLVQSFN